MTTNYTKDDPIFGKVDLDDVFITDAWLIERYVGNTLFGWGNATDGELGFTANATIYSSPIQVGALTNWRQVACGYRHTYAIKNDGSLWACGLNSIGLLGNGNIVSYSSPVQIGALTNWKQIDVTRVHSAASIVTVVKTDNTLWMWGYGNLGAFGNGTAASLYYSSPIQVGSLTNWKQVTPIGTGYGGFIAVKLDGTLWSCGYNDSGQLGNGTVNVYYSSPIQVGALTNWKQVVSNTNGFSAIKTDGTLWGCGRNILGQLGNGYAVNYSSPIQIGSLTNWKQLFTNTYNTLFAIKTDGTLWGWGENNFGQLGNGNAIGYSSPIQVGALTNWKQVSAGSAATLAITYADIT
jgi:hypothetical protein